MLSAPSPSHYNSTLGYTGKLRMGPCQTGEWVRERFLFAAVASRELPHDRIQETEEEATKLLRFPSACPLEEP